MTHILKIGFLDMNESKAAMAFESTTDEREIGLVDVADFLRANIIILVVCLVLGIAGSLVIFSHVPYKWRADITLQVGKMPISGNFVYITPPTQIVEKINSPFFLSKMLSLMYGKEVSNDSQVAALLYKDLKASMVKGSDLVNVQVFGRTADEAYKNASILADSIITEHRTMTAPFMNAMQKRLAEVIDNVAYDREVLRKVDAFERSAPSRNEANALLKVALIDAKTSEIQKLKKEQADLEETISAAKLQTTNIVGRSLLPRTPSSPKRGPLVLGGAFMGLLLGGLLSFSVAIFRRGRVA